MAGYVDPAVHSAKRLFRLPVKALGRHQKTTDSLVRTLIVIMFHPAFNRGLGFMKIGKMSLINQLPLNPQTLGKVEACNRRIKRELIDQKRFSNLHEAQAAVENWVEHYNYQRTHQGIGGFLVPAERFHGQAKKALCAIENGIELTGHNCAIPSDIERSVINLVLSPEGRITLYLLGQPIVLSGGEPCRKT